MAPLNTIPTNHSSPPVEALNVQVDLAVVVAPEKLGLPDIVVQGNQYPEPRASQFPPPPSPVHARIMVSLARFVAPQAFSEAARMSPWSSYSTADACSSRASYKICLMRSVLVVISP